MIILLSSYGFSKDTVLTTSVEVNGEPVRVRVGESIAIAHPESFVANNERAEGSETDGDELASRGDASKQAKHRNRKTLSLRQNSSS